VETNATERESQSQTTYLLEGTSFQINMTDTFITVTLPLSRSFPDLWHIAVTHD